MTDRDHDLGVGCAVAGNVSWELVYVRYSYGAVFSDRRTAHALSHWDIDTSRLALEWPKKQPAVLHEVEANPVYVLKSLPEQGRHIGQVRQRMLYSLNQSLEFLPEKSVQRDLIIGILFGTLMQHKTSPHVPRPSPAFNGAPQDPPVRSPEWPLGDPACERTALDSPDRGSNVRAEGM
jgi:hypothetical protein